MFAYMYIDEINYVYTKYRKYLNDKVNVLLVYELICHKNEGEENRSSDQLENNHSLIIDCIEIIYACNRIS